MNGSQPPQVDDKNTVDQPPPSFGRTILAVAWSLLGVRKGAEFERDLASITPMHVILVGLVAIFLLVLGLIVLVNWVV